MLCENHSLRSQSSSNTANVLNFAEAAAVSTLEFCDPEETGSVLIDALEGFMDSPDFVGVFGCLG